MQRRDRKNQERKTIMTVVVSMILCVVVFIALFLILKKTGDTPASEDPKNPEQVVDSVKPDEDNEEAVEDEDDIENPENTVDDLLGEPVTVWTTSEVRLRKTPDTTQPEIQMLPRKTQLEKYSEKDGWAHVKYGDVVGYVSMDYLSTEEPKVTGKVVVIDPGHQLKGESEKEPNGPNSSTMKARVTSGTRGVATGVAEYILNLDISLKLRDELESRGYTVYMTREVHEVKISNMERAKYATEVGADIAVRIHANGSENSSANGAETYVPSSSNPYVSHLASDSRRLGKCIIDAYCSATGFKNRGVINSDTMTGMNWSTVPVTIVEMGFMSNADDDRKMQDPQMQEKMVQGIADGIDAYFGN